MNSIDDDSSPATTTESTSVASDFSDEAFTDHTLYSTILRLFRQYVGIKNSRLLAAYHWYAFPQDTYNILEKYIDKFQNQSLLMEDCCEIFDVVFNDSAMRDFCKDGYLIRSSTSFFLEPYVMLWECSDKQTSHQVLSSYMTNLDDKVQNFVKAWHVLHQTFFAKYWELILQYDLSDNFIDGMNRLARHELFELPENQSIVLEALCLVNQKLQFTEELDVEKQHALTQLLSKLRVFDEQNLLTKQDLDELKKLNQYNSVINLLKQFNLFNQTNLAIVMRLVALDKLNWFIDKVADFSPVTKETLHYCLKIGDLMKMNAEPISLISFPSSVTAEFELSAHEFHEIIDTRIKKDLIQHRRLSLFGLMDSQAAHEIELVSSSNKTKIYT